jgi:hypothetical protein
VLKPSDWENAEADYDGSLPTTITNVKVVPDGAMTDHHLVEGGPLKKPIDLGSFLYEMTEEEAGPLLPIADLHRTKDR